MFLGQKTKSWCGSPKEKDTRQEKLHEGVLATCSHVATAGRTQGQREAKQGREVRLWTKPQMPLNGRAALVQGELQELQVGASRRAVERGLTPSLDL